MVGCATTRAAQAKARVEEMLILLTTSAHYQFYLFPPLHISGLRKNKASGRNPASLGSAAPAAPGSLTLQQGGDRWCFVVGCVGLRTMNCREVRETAMWSWGLAACSVIIAGTPSKLLTCCWCHGLAGCV